MRSIARILLLLLSFAPPAFAQLEPGAVVVYRVGTGAAPLTTAATEVFLDVFEATGAPLGSIALPTAASLPDRPLTATGTSVTEGFLNLSADCSFLTLTGYAAVPGTADVAASSAAAVPRVVGVVDELGTIDTTTALGDISTGASLRSAASTDGIDLWVGGSLNGVRFTTLGATTSTLLSAAPGNVRSVGIAGDQLYASTSATAGLRVGSVGTGLPTTGGQVVTNLPGFPTTSQPTAFAFADVSAAVPGLDVLYVADEGALALTKYSLDGGTWTADGTIGNDGNNYRGVAVVAVGDDVTIFATRNAQQLVRLVDTSGHGGTLTGTPQVLATAAANTAYRGVALAPGTACPEPGAGAAALAACLALGRLRRTRHS